MIEWIVTSSVLILLVILLRVLVKNRIGPGLRYALWGLVLIRLLVPGTLWESRASIMTPVAVQERYQVVERIPRYVQTRPDGWVDIGHNNGVTSIQEAKLENGDPIVYGWPERTEVPNIETLRKQVNLRDEFLLAWLAGAGMAGMFLLAVNLKFSRNLHKNRRTLGQYRGRWVFVMEGLASPCLCGLFRPAVYLTPDVTADDSAREHVLAHEYSHFQQGDHIWAALRGVCLAVHWYNPLIWLAAYLSRRDCELSCDERAVRLLGEACRADYGRTLVGLVARRTTPKDLACCATTMTGGKSALKERIALLVKRPKTTVWMACMVAAACVIFAACTFTGAVEEEPESPVELVQTVYQEPEEEAPSTSSQREEIKTQIALALTDWVMAGEVTPEDCHINWVVLDEWRIDLNSGEIQAVFGTEVMVRVSDLERSYWWAGNTMAAEEMEDDFYRDYDGWLVFWREGYALLDLAADQADQCSIQGVGTGGCNLDSIDEDLGLETEGRDYRRFHAIPEDLPTELMDLNLPEGEQGEWLLLAQAPTVDVALYRRAWNIQRVYLRITNQCFQVFDMDLSECDLLPTLDLVEGEADMTIQALYRRHQGAYFNGTTYEPGIVAEQVFYDWIEVEKFWTAWQITTLPGLWLTEDIPPLEDLLVEEVADITMYSDPMRNRTWLIYDDSIQEVDWVGDLPELYWEDFDNDGDRELAAINVTGLGTGVCVTELTVFEWDGQQWSWNTHDPSELIEVFNHERIYEFYDDGTAFISCYGTSVLLDVSSQWEMYWGDSQPNMCVLSESQVRYTCEKGKLVLTIAGQLLADGSPFLSGYVFEYSLPVHYYNSSYPRSWTGDEGELRSDFAIEQEPRGMTDTFRTVLATTWEQCDKSCPNSYAIHDVNADGKDELLVLWMPEGGVSSSWGTSVYDTDGKEKFWGCGELTFYSNGAISVPWSHNQGQACAIWPYDLYQYDKGEYTNAGGARAISSEMTAFPTEADLDGDGLVYYIGNDAYQESNPVDNAVYEAWRERYLSGAQVLPVQYQALTEDVIS